MQLRSQFLSRRFESRKRWFFSLIRLFISTHLKKSTRWPIMKRILSFIVLIRLSSSMRRLNFFLNLWFTMLLRYPRVNSLLLLLHFLTIFISLLHHNVLKGSQIMIDQVHMQPYQSNKKKNKDNRYKTSNPTSNHLSQILLPSAFLPQQQQSKKIEEKMPKSSIDHGNKESIVGFPNTIIDPNTMMIKLVNTPKSWFSYLSHFLQCLEVLST